MIKNRLRGAAYHLGKMDFVRLFRYYDRDNSGHIDRKEFISLVRRDGKIPPAKMSDLKLEKMFDTALDLDGTGDVSHEEFVQWVLEDPLHDGGGAEEQPPENEEQGPPMDTFTRLYMSKPTSPTRKVTLHFTLRVGKATLTWWSFCCPRGRALISPTRMGPPHLTLRVRIVTWK